MQKFCFFIFHTTTVTPPSPLPTVPSPPLPNSPPLLREGKASHGSQQHSHSSPCHSVRMEVAGDWGDQAELRGFYLQAPEEGLCGIQMLGPPWSDNSLKKRLSSSSSLWRDLELKSRPGVFRDEMQRSGVLPRDQLGRVELADGVDCLSASGLYQTLLFALHLLI